MSNSVLVRQEVDTHFEVESVMCDICGRQFKYHLEVEHDGVVTIYIHQQNRCNHNKIIGDKI